MGLIEDLETNLNNCEDVSLNLDWSELEKVVNLLKNLTPQTYEEPPVYLEQSDLHVYPYWAVYSYFGKNSQLQYKKSKCRWQPEFRFNKDETSCQYEIEVEDSDSYLSIEIFSKEENANNYLDEMLKTIEKTPKKVFQEQSKEYSDFIDKVASMTYTLSNIKLKDKNVSWDKLNSESKKHWTNMAMNMYYFVKSEI
jgi:hypothetical protein